MNLAEAIAAFRCLSEDKDGASGRPPVDTDHPKMRKLIAQLKKNPKVRNPRALAAYIVRRAAARKAG